jgi:hypothetical protein
MKKNIDLHLMLFQKLQVKILNECSSDPNNILCVNHLALPFDLYTISKIL